GAALQGLRLGGEMIYRGTFGTALFQCVYQPGPAHWAMLPSTLEWHAAAALVALGGLVWWPALGVAAGMLTLSALVACLQAVQARLPAEHDGLASRLLVAGLCYAQPLVRSWRRYRTRLFSYRAPALEGEVAAGRPTSGLPLLGERAVAYWTEGGVERTELLNRVVACLNE